MILFEYECWKCGEMHTSSAATLERFDQYRADMPDVFMRVTQGEIACNDCGKMTQADDLVLHDNGETFCYECQ